MIIKLIGINVRALFSGLFSRYKKKKKLSPIMLVLVALLAVYVTGACLLFFGLMFNSICTAFFEAGIPWLYFSFVGLTVFALCFVSSIFMAQAHLFSAKDNELLLAMPLKPSEILAGRVVTMLLFEYAFELCVIIPALAVLFVNGNISTLPVAGIVFFFITALFLPLPPLALGCFTGWIVAVITSRMRNKNVPVFVLTILLAGGYMWLNSQLSRHMQMLIANSTAIAGAVRRAIFPVYHLGISVSGGNPVSLIIFIICAAAPFVIMYTLLSHSFYSITTTNAGAKKLKYREKKMHTTGVGTALLKKEIRRFFINPMYVLNAGMGMIMCLILTGVLLIRPSALLNVVSAMVQPGSGITYAGIAVAALLLLTSTNIITAPSISLEGSKLWLIKSLPVRSRDILLSKVMAQVVICGVPLFLAGLCCIVRLPGVGVLDAVILLLAPALLNAVLSLFGVIINLHFPRFDWINELQPIKQSVSSVLTMFSSIGLVSIFVVLYIFVFASTVTIQVYMLLCTTLLALLTGLLYLYLQSEGSRRFDALES